jgi:NAD(P)H-dependent FMN reductase
MHLLLISGSPREGSTNTALLRTLAAHVPAGTTAALSTSIGALPHFDPGAAPDSAVSTFLREIVDADVVVVCTPEYAGALPGSFKNALEWTVGGGELYEKPVAVVNSSSMPTGAADAYASLAIVLRYLSARVIANEHIPVTRAMIGPGGLIADEAVVRALTTLAQR